MLILPAIDLRGGNAVRLAQGDFAREKVYDTDPVTVAKGFIDSGAQWLHVVDLDGAKAGVPQHWRVIGAIAALGVPVEFGGGVRSMDTAHRLINVGVTRFVVGTSLLSDPEFAKTLFTHFGSKVAAGIDARDGNAAGAAWEHSTITRAEDLSQRVAEDGCTRIILTDIARDGMQTGPNLELLASVKRASKLPVIHSGGIGSVADIETLAALGSDAPEGVIIGRALYEGSFDLEEALAVTAMV